MNSFQKYWSFINRIVVEEKSTPYNPKLIVAIQNGKYVLNTSNANYSFGSLHRVFQKTFQKIKLTQKNYKNCLLLGGGAGSVPFIFYNELALNVSTILVEIDEEVIKLGEKYFELKNYPKLHLTIEDAFVFVTKTNKTFDFIIIDIFKDLMVPTCFLDAVFFDNIKKVLNPNGMVVFNFVSFNYETKQQVKKIEQLLSTVFSKNYRVTVYKIESLNKVFVVEGIE